MGRAGQGFYDEPAAPPRGIHAAPRAQRAGQAQREAAAGRADAHDRRRVQGLDGAQAPPEARDHLRAAHLRGGEDLPPPTCT